jgi:uncharacterized protein YndB with AHSA1/START domain
MRLAQHSDVRPRGRFSVVFRLLNGEEHNPTGVYKTLIPNEKIMFNWEWPGMPERESLVTFLLKPIDSGTELTLIHGYLHDDVRESHKLGWNGWADKLAAFLTSS